MIPELEAALKPLLDAVDDAQATLDAANRSVDTNPLDCLAPAGRVIRVQADLIHRMWELLDCVGQPITNETRMRVQGRLRELQHQKIPR